MLNPQPGDIVDVPMSARSMLTGEMITVPVPVRFVRMMAGDEYAIVTVAFHSSEPKDIRVLASDLKPPTQDTTSAETKEH